MHALTLLSAILIANVENKVSSYNASKWQMGFNSAFKGLTTTAGIVTDGRTAIIETFTPFKCPTAAESLITVLCLKSSVDICGFYAFVHKKLHHHTLFHARTNTVVCHLD